MRKNSPRMVLIAICCLTIEHIAIAQSANVAVNYDITSSATVTATQTITASKAISGSGSVVTFTAGQTISLIPGFTVSGVSNFTAKIGTPGGRLSAEELLTEDDGNGSLKIYPNPLQDNTTIQFYVTGNATSEIVVYNFRGDEIRHLEFGKSPSSGKREVKFDASALAPGLYIVELIAGDKKEFKKLLKL